MSAGGARRVRVHGSAAWKPLVLALLRSPALSTWVEVHRHLTCSDCGPTLVLAWSRTGVDVPASAVALVIR